MARVRMRCNPKIFQNPSSKNIAACLVNFPRLWLVKSLRGRSWRDTFCGWLLPVAVAQVPNSQPASWMAQCYLRIVSSLIYEWWVNKEYCVPLGRLLLDLVMWWGACLKTWMNYVKQMRLHSVWLDGWLLGTKKFNLDDMPCQDQRPANIYVCCLPQLNSIFYWNRLCLWIWCKMSTEV
jgi:hypothetical protein